MKTVFCLLFLVEIVLGEGHFQPTYGHKPFHPPTLGHGLSLPKAGGFHLPKIHKPHFDHDLQNQGPPPSFWTRVIEGVSIRQKGFASNTPFDDRVVVITLPRNLADLGLTPSQTLWDFSGDEPVTVVRVGKRCFLVPTTNGLTFDAARDEVEARNGNTVTVPLPPAQDLVAIGGRLTSQEVRILVRETPTIKTFCPGEIFQTTPGPLPDPIPQGQIVTSVVTLDTRFNILTTLASPRVHGKRRPKKRGGFGGVVYH